MPDTQPVYRQAHPQAVFGDPDLVLEFLPLAEARARWKRWDQPRRQHLDRVAPIPARGDRSLRARQLRRQRTKLRAAYREGSPLVGDRLILKKRNSQPMRRGAKMGIGKTNLWRCFEAWAIGRLRQASDRHPRSWLHWPLSVPVHLAWRYHPPDDQARPDHPGVSETVADLVQDAGLVVNDKLVAYDDLSRIEAPDPVRPRLEIWVRAVER